MSEPICRTFPLKTFGIMGEYNKPLIEFKICKTEQLKLGRKGVINIKNCGREIVKINKTKTFPKIL